MDLGRTAVFSIGIVPAHCRLIAIGLNLQGGVALGIKLGQVDLLTGSTRIAPSGCLLFDQLKLIGLSLKGNTNMSVILQINLYTPYSIRGAKSGDFTGIQMETIIGTFSFNGQIALGLLGSRTIDIRTQHRV